MLIGIVALRRHRIDMLLVVLFCSPRRPIFSARRNTASCRRCWRGAAVARQRPAGTHHLRGHRGRHQLRHIPVRALEGRAADAWALTLLAIAVAGSLASLRITQGSRGRLARAVPLESVPRSLDRGAQRLRSERALWLTVVGISWFWFIGALFQMTAAACSATETLHRPETRRRLAGDRAGRGHRRGQRAGRAALRRPHRTRYGAGRLGADGRVLHRARHDALVRVGAGVARRRRLRRRPVHRAAERLSAGPRRPRGKGPHPHHQQLHQHAGRDRWRRACSGCCTTCCTWSAGADACWRSARSPSSAPS